MALPPTFESGNAVLQTIHASEGGRAYLLLKKRQRQQEEAEKARQMMEQETVKKGLSFSKIDSKFGGSVAEELEQKFKEETVGLVSVDEFREKRKKLNEMIEEQDKKEKEKDKQSKIRLRQATRSKVSISIGMDEEEDEDEDNPEGVKKEEDDVPKKKYLGKDPSVETAFLQDADREEKLADERRKLVLEYQNNENAVKKEMLEVTFSYWDGTGHRRTTRISKGATVGEFVAECRKSLEVEFPELKFIASENLLYVKEDIILPHRLTFYELIKTKARGKSGPMFCFDVHEDIRQYSDTRLEVDESHAGKIVDRRWYERNKHIFPASRWEVYDPNKTFDKYTIYGNSNYARDADS